MLLTGRTVVVTGAASGIGSAIARRAVEEGARVAGWDLDETQADGVLPVLCDVGDEPGVRRAQEETAEALGAPDVLVNNVGVVRVADWRETTAEQWERALALNLTSAWLCSRALLPAMVSRGRGSIVNVSSVHAVRTMSGHVPYAVSKAGLEALTRGLALEVGPHGVRVNAVAPGWVGTRRVLDYLEGEPGVREQLERLHPLGRIGTPDEIAAAVVFLASDACPFVHGAVLVADGGLSVQLGGGGESRGLTR